MKRSYWDINDTRMTDTIEADEIPLHTIAFDHAAFEQLSSADRDAFWYQARRLEELGYMVSKGRPDKEWAFIDFDEYPSFDEYLARCRKIHKGNAIRDALKSERKGYYSKFFNPSVFVADIVAVNTSTPERQGAPMAQHYFLPVEQRGGYPAAIASEIPPSQSFIWMRHFGIFRENSGHRQGNVVVDEQLLGYAIVRRCSQFLFYSTFLGHDDFLRDGVTYKMHLDLVKTILMHRNARNQITPIDISLSGARYLFYARYYGQGSGLLLWKKRMLFAPGFFEFAHPLPPPGELAERQRGGGVSPGITPPTPFVIVADSQRRAEPDYKNAGFAVTAEKRPSQVAIYGGHGAEPDGEGCLSLFRALVDKDFWVAARGILIGDSIVGPLHPAVAEGLAHIFTRLAPDATIYAGNSNGLGTTVSETGRSLGEWLLQRVEEIAKLPEASAVEAERLYAFWVGACAHRAMGLSTLLRHLAPERLIERILAVGIGTGTGMIAYFLSDDASTARNKLVSIVEPHQRLHASLRQLYAIESRAHEDALAFTIVHDVAELGGTWQTWDLILCDAAIWRIPGDQRAVLFARMWNSLSPNGFFVVNAVVRSGQPDSQDIHDRNFAHALPRDELVNLMTFDRTPDLYRAVSSWSRAEEPAATAAKDWSTSSFLVATRGAAGEGAEKFRSS